MIWLRFFISVALAVSDVSGVSNVSDIPEVTVTAKKSRLSSSEPAERIELEDSGDLNSSLAKVPSISVRRRGENDGALPQVRGQDERQSRWFLEQVPLNSSGFGASSAHLIPPEALASMAIYPQGVPSFLAEDGLGGAFLLRLKRNRNPSLRASMRAASFGSQRIAAQSWNRNVGLTFVHHQGNEDFPYYDSNGTPFNIADDVWRDRESSAFSRLTLLPFGTWKLNDFELRTLALMSRGTSQVPGPITARDSGELKDQVYIVSAEVERNSAYSIGTFGVLGIEEYKPSHSSAIGTAALFSKSNRIGMSLRTRVNEWGEVTLRPQKEWFETNQFNESKIQTKFWLPLGLSLQVEDGPWAFSPGLVFHFVEFTDKSYGLLSPRLWVTREFGKVTGNLNLGGYFRSPTMSELYGQARILSSNPQLSPERSWKAELGAQYKLTIGLEGSLTHFQSLSTDTIVYSENAQKVMTTSNIGSAWIWGTAAELKAKRGNLAGTVSAFQLATKNLSPIPSQNGKELPYRAQFEVTTRVDWSFWKSGVWLSNHLIGPLFTDSSNRHRILTTSTFDCGWQFKSDAWGDLEVSVFNLADSMVSTHVAGNYSYANSMGGLVGYPASGRRVSLSWRISL